MREIDPDYPASTVLLKGRIVICIADITSNNKFYGTNIYKAIPDSGPGPFTPLDGPAWITQIWRHVDVSNMPGHQLTLDLGRGNEKIGGTKRKRIWKVMLYITII